MKKIFILLGILLFSAGSLAANYENTYPQATAKIEAKAKARKHRVVLYYTSYCHYCHSLMAKLRSLGVRFTAVNVENNPKPGIDSVPVTYIDGVRYDGDISMSTLKRIFK
jgi:glutaredoxin